MSRDRHCRICRKRPPWAGKNCPPGVCRVCYHRHIWVDRPAARAERRAAAALGPDDDGGNWIEVLVESDGEVATSEVAADEREPQLPPWPIRRVTAAMKRCPLPDAKELTICSATCWRTTPTRGPRATRTSSGPCSARWTGAQRYSWSSRTTG